MAVYWPGPNSGCRVDLLVCSFNQLMNAVDCQDPYDPGNRNYGEALTIWEMAQGIRAAGLLLNTVAYSADSLVDKATNILANRLPDALNETTAFLHKIGLNAQDALKADAAYLSAQNKSILDKIVGGISKAVTGSEDTLGIMADKAKAGLSTALTTAQTALGAVVNTVKTGVGNAVDVASAAVGGFITTARTTLDALITNVRNGVSVAINTATATLGALADTAGTLFGQIATTVKTYITDLVKNVQTGIGALVAKLGDIPGALFGVAQEVIAAVGGAVDDVVSGLGAFLGDPITGIIGGFFHGEEPRLLSLVDRVYDRLLENPETPADLRAMVEDAKVPGAPIPAIIAAVVVPFVIITSLGTIFQPIIEKMVQEERAIVRPTLFGLGDAVQAHKRGALTLAQLNEQAFKSGYTDELLAAALKLGEQLPTPNDLADWRHRGFMADGVMVERLQQQGWRAEDATHILDASEVIPPVGDLVRFAVREAFPGQTGFSGARGASVPPRFTELAEMQGLDAEFAKSYWAAHWELPSVTAAFQMYHRGIIEETELRALLKEQDFAPEWIDRIIAVAYDPLTRVDVRRMYALGVLSKSQVEESYRDLGYSQRNASRLADFVEVDVADSANTETAAERDLTRADLIGAYSDGILSKPQAGTMLRELGYSADETELVLDREDIRVMRAERKETRTAIIDQAVADVITVVTAQDKLSAAGYTADEITAAMREIERKTAAAVKEPTKAELDKFRRYKLISDEEYRAELARLGYAQKWIDRFIALGSSVGVNDGGDFTAN